MLRTRASGERAPCGGGVFVFADSGRQRDAEESVAEAKKKRRRARSAAGKQKANAVQSWR
jgi:hypothetical protein